MKKMNRIAEAPFLDPTIPDVAVEIDGEKFRLCFDFAGLAVAKAKLREHKVDINILQSLDFSSLDVDTLPPLFFAAALRYQPGLTWERAQQLVNLRTSVGIYSAMASAYAGAMMEPGKNPPGAAAANQ